MMISFLNIPRTKAHSPFSPNEDEHLKMLVEKYGTDKWDLISKEMKNRSFRQCKDRWNNALCDNIKKGEWTKEEDELLLQKYSEFGSRWKYIEKFFPGRVSYSLRNRHRTLTTTKNIRKSKNKQSQTGNDENNEIREIDPLFERSDDSFNNDKMTQENQNEKTNEGIYEDFPEFSLREDMRFYNEPIKHFLEFNLKNEAKTESKHDNFYFNLLDKLMSNITMDDSENFEQVCLFYS
ncbi:Myb-like DNA-binding domain containing protein [Tritrichomonas foetus]|uniref:Myb-like DNA-binding domain containing protein n=1 Tax=Tritrichomonas foetus TaxID=1144522 RepID=A0A1J4JE48_9EUKA|nr:Myb-like DNA-binding domain containing protein [Tritrichomonas foetus]|eukprot:OHS97384.1 Myb-like DNA-binding domain containing protein [Tritrichomonas foetus]